jgi:hypothetical protein
MRQRGSSRRAWRELTVRRRTAAHRSSLIFAASAASVACGFTGAAARARARTRCPACDPVYLARFVSCEAVPFFANCRFTTATSCLRCSGVRRLTAFASRLRSSGVSRFIASASRSCSCGVNPASGLAGAVVLFLAPGVLAGPGRPWKAAPESRHKWTDPPHSWQRLPGRSP